MRERKMKLQERLLSNRMPQHPGYLSEMGRRPAMSFPAAKAKTATHLGTDAITKRAIMRKCTWASDFPSVRSMELGDGVTRRSAKAFWRRRSLHWALTKSMGQTPSTMTIGCLSPQVGAISFLPAGPYTSFGKHLPLIPGHVVGEGQTLTPQPISVSKLCGPS